jgi:hypothetical protein
MTVSDAMYAQVRVIHEQHVRLVAEVLSRTDATLALRMSRRIVGAVPRVQTAAAAPVAVTRTR